MNALDRDHYACGWNDTEYGINGHWTGSVTYANPLQWAIAMRKIAQEMQPLAVGSHNKAHYQGVIDCVTEYQTTGKVERKKRASIAELNS